MKPRYTKRVREEAALICAIAASGGVWCGDKRRRTYGDIHLWLGSSDDAFRLALDAWDNVKSRGCHRSMTNEEAPWSPGLDAEAAALLEDGWSP